MKYKIHYGCGCGEEEGIIEAESMSEAVTVAYEYAVENYESYEGLHGIRSRGDIAAEDFGIDDYYEHYGDLDPRVIGAIDEAYFDERESQLDYWTEEYEEEKEEWD